MTSNVQLREISREEAAAEVLSIWEETNFSLRTSMRRLANEWKITDWQIRTAIHSLVFETVRHLNTIDYALNSVLDKTQINDLDPLVRNNLRVAAYLILYHEGAPALVTNEAVSIVKKRRNKRLAGFCNAVLRKVQGTQLESLIKSEDKLRQWELEYCVPRWLIDYFQQISDSKETHAFLETSAKSPAVYIRINELKSDTKRVLQELEKDEFQCIPINQFPEMFRLQRGNKPITQSEAYTQNTVYLQGLSSALVSRIVNPDPQDILLDLCAAPGSKTTHLAQLMKNQGNIIAIDNLPLRVMELKRNLVRLGVRNTHVLMANSFRPPFRNGFQGDLVLVDPPCSNTGVIQSRPEVKWTMTLEKIQRLQRVQTSLLRQGSQLVRPGGSIVYSTCSISLEENEQLIKKFLKANADFKLVPTEPWIGSEAFEGLSECQRLYPHRENTEGFFIAKMKRMMTSNLKSIEE
ncbi:MAG: 16S rRNA (cytosine(967)-C(5))-methyltransferase RsmB [Candidatus Thorarchaeota archaeon]